MELWVTSVAVFLFSVINLVAPFGEGFEKKDLKKLGEATTDPTVRTTFEKVFSGIGIAILVFVLVAFIIYVCHRYFKQPIGVEDANATPQQAIVFHRRLGAIEDREADVEGRAVPGESRAVSESTIEAAVQRREVINERRRREARGEGSREAFSARRTWIEASHRIREWQLRRSGPEWAIEGRTPSPDEVRPRSENTAEIERMITYYRKQDEHLY